MKIVMKFGGTSLADGRRIRHVAKLVKSHLPNHSLTVVASAMNGVTDQLLEAANIAEKGQTHALTKFWKGLLRHHLVSAKTAVHRRPILLQTTRAISALVSQLRNVLTGITVLTELTPRSRDLVLSFGERLSAPILAASLQDLGVRARALTGGEAGIVTDENFGEAQPLMEVSRLEVKSRLESPISEGTVPVVAGFLGRTQNGEITTLGRGGSDYSATILAVCLGADEAWIWTDVDGLMTADPRLVGQARVLEELSYAEAAEMAVFGAKAMHPRALEPAMEASIPVVVRNTFRPDAKGTRVSETKVGGRGKVVKAVALVRNVGMVTVAGGSMVGKPGTAAKIFETLGRNGINIQMISQSVSESGISMVIGRSMLQAAVNALELNFLGKGQIREVHAEEDVAVVAVIGAGMKGTPGVASKVFTAVAKRGINVEMIAQGSSELNISFVVRESEGPRAVRAIHGDLRLG